MAFVIDNLMDTGLETYASDAGNAVYITVAEATTYGQATTTDVHRLGTKTGITLGAIANGPTDGRQITIPAITDGTVDGTGTQTASHWALTDGASILLATGPLTSTQSVTNGNTWTLDEIRINIRDFAAV